MAIKTLDQLSKDLGNGDDSAKYGWRLNDLVKNLSDSVFAVGGTMYLDADTPIDLTTAWQPFQWFSHSIDTKGLNEDLAAGTFTTQAGAGGLYKVVTTIGILSAFSGWVQIALTKEGALTPFKSKRTLVSGVSGNIGVLGSGNIADGETFGLAIRASGAATVTCESGQLMAWR